MAVALSREENGRRILDIYKNFNSEGDHVLQANNFIAVAARRNWSAKHLKDGLSYAIEQGWVEELSTGGLKLTDVGFKEM